MGWGLDRACMSQEEPGGEGGFADDRWGLEGGGVREDGWG